MAEEYYPGHVVNYYGAMIHPGYFIASPIDPDPDEGHYITIGDNIIWYKANGELVSRNQATPELPAGERFPKYYEMQEIILWANQDPDVRVAYIPDRSTANQWDLWIGTDAHLAGDSKNSLHAKAIGYQREGDPVVNDGRIHLHCLDDNGTLGHTMSIGYNDITNQLVFQRVGPSTDPDGYYVQYVRMKEHTIPNGAATLSINGVIYYAIAPEMVDHDFALAHLQVLQEIQPTLGWRLCTQNDLINLNEWTKEDLTTRTLSTYDPANPQDSWELWVGHDANLGASSTQSLYVKARGFEDEEGNVSSPQLAVFHRGIISGGWYQLSTLGYSMNQLSVGSSGTPNMPYCYYFLVRDDPDYTPPKKELLINNLYWYANPDEDLVLYDEAITQVGTYPTGYRMPTTAEISSLVTWANEDPTTRIYTNFDKDTNQYEWDIWIGTDGYLGLQSEDSIWFKARGYVKEPGVNDEPQSLGQVFLHTVQTTSTTYRWSILMYPSSNYETLLASQSSSLTQPKCNFIAVRDNTP